MTELILLWLAAFPLMGSPGPATLSLAALGSTYGVKQSFSYYVGIVLGTVGVLLLIATGVTAIILAAPRLTQVITILAALYIVYLAYKIATAPVGQSKTLDASAPGFGSGFLLAIANPKAFAAIGAVYSSHTLITSDLKLDAAFKILALSVVIVCVNGLWLLAGNIFSKALKNPKTAKAINILFAGLLILSVGTALFMI